MVAIATAGYSIGWWSLYWVPNEAMVLPDGNIKVMDFGIAANGYIQC